MVPILKLILALCLINYAQSSDIDSKHLQCLVCRVTIEELQGELDKIDPSRKMEVGNYRLDTEGNTITKKVSLAQSEIHLSEVMDSICEKLDDYIRGTYKTNGSLTIFNLKSSSGGMNPLMSEVDIIQDSDLNRSLKYYCEEMVAEHEDSIISTLKNGAEDLKKSVCVNQTNLCKDEDPEDEYLHEEDLNETHEEL